MFAEHGPQGGLRQLAGAHKEVFDLNDRLLRVKNPEVEHCVNLHRDVVAGNHILCRHIEHHGAQIHANHLLHHRNQQNQSRPLDPPKAPELEHHPALVFAQNPDGREHQHKEQG
ncbi:hypothetical protein D3C71_1220980 [compost metagenome]